MNRSFEFIVKWYSKTAVGALPLVIVAALVFTCSPAMAAKVVDLSASSGTDTTVDGAVVTTWESTTPAGDTTFTRSGSDARYVADSGLDIHGNPIPAIDFDRSAPFAGDFTAANGSAIIGDATIFAWANFDGYTDHGATSSSYYYSIQGDDALGKNEHTLGRDGNDGTDYIYHWDNFGQTTGTLQPQPAGWNLYIARFYGASLVGTTSAEAWIDPVGNGAVVANAADLVNEDSLDYATDPANLKIGTWTSGTSGLDGQIRAVRIYNTILNNDEIGRAARDITGVPEPSTIVIAVIGLIGCGGFRRRG